jgi:hypothetical protein
MSEKRKHPAELKKTTIKSSEALNRVSTLKEKIIEEDHL